MAASTFAAAGCVETALLPRRIRLMMIHMAWRCWCGKSIYAPQPGRIVTDGALALSQLPEAADYTAGRASLGQLMRLHLAHREEVAC
jgi:hypothetical protein